MDFILHGTLLYGPVVLSLLQLLDSLVQRVDRLFVFLCKLACLSALLGFVSLLVGRLEQAIKVRVLFC